MSFDEFINRPLSEIEKIIEVINEFDKKKLKANESIMKDIEKDKNSLKSDLDNFLDTN